MSLYTFAIWPNQAIVAADTRMCAVIDGKAYRQNDTTFKLHVIDDTVITCGGASWLCTYILQRWIQDEARSVESLHRIALESINDIDRLSSVLDPTGALAKHSRGTDYLLEILVLQFDKVLGHNVLYQISSYNDYSLVRHDITNPNCTMAYGGIDQKIVQKYLMTHDTSTFDKYLASLVPAYREAASEKVGGYLSVAVQEHGKVTFAPLWAKIPDTRNIADCPPTASIIMSRNIIGNNLILQSQGDDGGVKQFQFDSTGAWLNNAVFVLQSNNGGKMLLHPDYGIAGGTKDIYTVQGTTVRPLFINDDGKIIMDQDGFPQNVNFYIDPRDGSTYLRGKVYATDGVFNGTVYARNGEFTGSIHATSGDFSGTIKAATLDGTLVGGANGGALEGISLNVGDGNFVVDGNGNVQMAGSINLANGDITWGNNTPVKYQFSANGSSGWHDTMTSGDKYRRDSLDGGVTWGSAYQFRGTDGKDGDNGRDGSDATVTRANIVKAMLDSIDQDGLYTTTIDGKQVLGINATAIKTGTLTGIDIYGGAYHDLSGKSKLVLNPDGSISRNADLRLYSGDNIALNIYDEITGAIRWSSYGKEFLLTGNCAGVEGAQPQGVWDFSNADVRGVHAVFA